MQNKVNLDSLILAEDSLLKNAETASNNNPWMWIATAEFFILLTLFFLLFIRKKKNTKNLYKRESLKQNVDFNNIINSSFNSKVIYNELKIKCHPDRFATNIEKNKIALVLFQEITKNKNNIKELLKLKEEAAKKLNINF